LIVGLPIIALSSLDT